MANKHVGTHSSFSNGRLFQILYMFGKLSYFDS